MGYLESSSYHGENREDLSIPQYLAKQAGFGKAQMIGDAPNGSIKVGIVTTGDFHYGPIWKLKMEAAANGTCRVAESTFEGIGS